MKSPRAPRNDWKPQARERPMKMNLREPLKRFVTQTHPKIRLIRMAPGTVGLWRLWLHVGTWHVWPGARAPVSPEQRGHQHRSQLRYAEHGNPDGVRGTVRPAVGRPQGRHISPAGTGELPEANAGSRKAQGTHNLPDRSSDQPERALTESMVCYPDDVAREPNLRTS